MLLANVAMAIVSSFVALYGGLLEKSPWCSTEEIDDYIILVAVMQAAVSRRVDDDVSEDVKPSERLAFSAAMAYAGLINMSSIYIDVETGRLLPHRARIHLDVAERRHLLFFGMLGLALEGRIAHLTRRPGLLCRWYGGSVLPQGMTWFLSLLYR